MNNKSNQGINIKDGNNEIKDNIFNFYPSEEPFNLIKYIPKHGSANFVGRENELIKVHEKLYKQNNRVAIPDTAEMACKTRVQKTGFSRCLLWAQRCSAK